MAVTDKDGNLHISLELNELQVMQRMGIPTTSGLPLSEIITMACDQHYDWVERPRGNLTWPKSTPVAS